MKDLFYDAGQVADLLHISRSKAYQLIREMNADLEKRGYLVIAGRVPSAYLLEKVYGGMNERDG